MDNARHLLTEFAKPSLEAWRQEVERLLKGASFEHRMFTGTWEGPAINPLYTAVDTDGIPWLDTLPGQPPFVRGSRPSAPCDAPWLIAQELTHATCQAFNEALRHDLQRGQTVVNLICDAMARPRTSVRCLADLATAFDGVDLNALPVNIAAGTAALPLTAALAALIRDRGGDVGNLRGCIGGDPFARLAREGRFPDTTDGVFDDLAILNRWAADNAPGLRTLVVSEQPWHEGGADLALSLGLTLSSGVALLRALETRDLPPEAVAPHVQFEVQIGTDFFMEMAKLRALRLLWSRILIASAVAPEAAGTFVHARTGRRCLTTLDPHVNLLRATTTAMSAVLGGADSLHVSSFDEVDRRPDRFGRRIARNVQLILMHECSLGRVADPAGGSWYVESLTRDLAEAAWTRFQDAERAGGFPAVLESGWAQEQVVRAAKQRAADFASRRQVLVGTSKHPVAATNAETVSSGTAVADRRAPETKRSAVAEGPDGGFPACLEGIETVPSAQLFERLVTAAAAGASLDDMARARRRTQDAVKDVTPVPLRRDAEPFENMRRRVGELANAQPAAGRVFAACLGNFARYLPRLDFVRDLFGVGGFTVAGETWFPDASAAASAAGEDGARTVILVGLDETYAGLAAAAARSLAESSDPPTILLAGVPGDLESKLRAAGVTGFIHARCDVLDVLQDLVQGLEGQS